MKKFQNRHLNILKKEKLRHKNSNSKSACGGTCENRVFATLKTGFLTKFRIFKNYFYSYYTVLILTSRQNMPG